jgi:CheY-like chemotaxis protein
MKQRIVIIDKDVKMQTLLESYLTEYEIINIVDYIKAVELCKKAAPDLIIIGFLPKNDFDATSAVRTLKRDVSTKNVPIIGLYHNIDRIQAEKDRKEGVEAYLVKSANKDVLKAKIKECINNAKAQKQYDSFKSKSHIKIENPTPNSIKISFQSGLKYVLPEIKNIFNAELLTSIKSRECCLDIRDFPAVSKEDALVLEKIVSVLGKKRIGLIVGKHMGAIISQSNLENQADLFMNLDDYIDYLNKPQTKQNIESI